MEVPGFCKGCPPINALIEKAIEENPYSRPTKIGLLDGIRMYRTERARDIQVLDQAALLNEFLPADCPGKSDIPLPTEHGMEVQTICGRELILRTQG